MFKFRLNHSIVFKHCDNSQNTNDYSITVSQEFANEFWKKELTQVDFKKNILKNYFKIYFKKIFKHTWI